MDEWLANGFTSGWAQNTMLQPLSAQKAEEALSHGSKMKKDLKLAFELATKEHSLDYFKNLIVTFQQAQAEEVELMEARAKAAETKSKSKKSKATVDGDGDLDMPDDEDAVVGKAPKTKKRKADADTTVSWPKETCFCVCCDDYARHCTDHYHFYSGNRSYSEQTR